MSKIREHIFPIKLSIPAYPARKRNELFWLISRMSNAYNHIKRRPHEANLIRNNL
jgi:hypothetical protein